MNSCVNSPEDGPVGPKHVEIRRYMNKIEIVTSVGFSFHSSETVQLNLLQMPQLECNYNLRVQNEHGIFPNSQQHMVRRKTFSIPV